MLMYLSTQSSGTVFLALEPNSSGKTGDTSSLGTHQKSAMQIPRHIHQLYNHLYKRWTCCLPTDTNINIQSVHMHPCGLWIWLSLFFSIDFLFGLGNFYTYDRAIRTHTHTNVLYLPSILANATPRQGSSNATRWKGERHKGQKLDLSCWAQGKWKKCLQVNLGGAWPVHHCDHPMGFEKKIFTKKKVHESWYICI